MIRLSIAPLGAALLALAACVQEPLPLPGIEDPDACKASELQGLVGQPASALDTMKFSQPLRVLRPGMAVTMDYSAARLNIEVDAAETITRVSCG